MDSSFDNICLQALYHEKRSQCFRIYAFKDIRDMLVRAQRKRIISTKILTNNILLRRCLTMRNYVATFLKIYIYIYLPQIKDVRRFQSLHLGCATLTSF